MTKNERTTSESVAAMRRFNRFYTRRIGVLNERLSESPFSLTEARVLYELAQRDDLTAVELVRGLGLDASYLSRILNRFRKQGLLVMTTSRTDARRSLLRLTDVGRDAFAPLDLSARDEAHAILDKLSLSDRFAVSAAMETIERFLGPIGPEPVPCVLRQPRPGDFGWVVHRHGALYAEEYGWDETFEGLVADIVAQFINRLKPERERCWIADRNGEVVGSVFLVEESAEEAKLRLLYVEPKARGLGIGKRLLQESIRFAKDAGYKSVRLWTNDVLVGARRLYQAAGFRLVHEEAHHSFGCDLNGQTWVLDL